MPRTKKPIVLVRYGKARISRRDLMEFLRQKGAKTFTLYLTKDGDTITIHLEKPSQFQQKVIAKDRGVYIELIGLDDGVYEILRGYDELILIPSGKKIGRTKIIHDNIYVRGTIIRRVKLDKDREVIEVKIDRSAKPFLIHFSKGKYKVTEVYYNDKVAYYVERLEKPQKIDKKLMGFECEKDECNIAFVTSPKMKTDEDEKKVVIFGKYVFAKDMKMLKVQDVMENVNGYIVRFEESNEPLRKFNVKVSRGKYVATYDPDVKTMFIVRLPQT